MKLNIHKLTVLYDIDLYNDFTSSSEKYKGEIISIFLDIFITALFVTTSISFNRKLYASIYLKFNNYAYTSFKYTEKSYNLINMVLNLQILQIHNLLGDLFFA